MSRIGQLLVASPTRPDEFRHAVVLIIRENEEGTTGAILNRPIGQSLKEVWSSLKAESNVVGPCDSDELIYFGGPVFGPIYAIHKLAEHSDEELVPGLFWSVTSDKLNKIVVSDAPFRILTGYAKWAEGQLEEEIAQTGWLTIPSQDDLIFAADPDHDPKLACMYLPDTWKRGWFIWGHQMWQSFGINHIPSDSKLN